MTFDEVKSEEPKIPLHIVLREIRKHDADVHLFFEEMGHHPTYNGWEVLAWLGY